MISYVFSTTTEHISVISLLVFNIFHVSTVTYPFYSLLIFQLLKFSTCPLSITNGRVSPFKHLIFFRLTPIIGITPPRHLFFYLPHMLPLLTTYLKSIAVTCFLYLCINRESNTSINSSAIIRINTSNNSCAIIRINTSNNSCAISRINTSNNSSAISRISICNAYSYSCEKSQIYNFYHLVSKADSDTR